VSRGLGPKQKMILTLLWNEKDTERVKPYSATYWYNKNNYESKETRLEAKNIFQLFYNMKGSDEEIYKQIHNFSLIEKQKVYNPLKRLHKRGLIEYKRGEIRAYIDPIEETIKNFKTGQIIPLKRLINY